MEKQEVLLDIVLSRLFPYQEEDVKIAKRILREIEEGKFKSFNFYKKGDWRTVYVYRKLLRYGIVKVEYLGQGKWKRYVDKKAIEEIARRMGIEAVR